jgi:signal transduction histidine kinase
VSALGLYLLAAAVSILGGFVANARSAPVNRRFSAFTYSIAGWVIGIAGLETGTTPEFWGRASFAGACMIPATFLMFAHVFPAASEWPSRSSLLLAVGLGAALAVTSLATPLVVYDVIRTADGISRSSGVLYPLFSVYVLTCAVGSVALFMHKWLRLRGLARAQLHYLAIGVLLFAAGGVTANLLIPLVTGRSHYTVVGPYFALPLVLLVAHAIIRHRLMDLRFVIHRGLSYVVVLGAVSLALVLGGRLFIPAWRATTLALPLELTITCLAIVAMLTKPGSFLLHQLVDPYLYRGRLDHATALNMAMHELTTLMPLEELAERLQRLLMAAYVPENVVVLVLTEAGGLEPASATPSTTSALVAHPALFDVLQRTNTPSAFLVSAFDRISQADDVRFLQEHGVEVIATLGRRRHPLGVLLLGPRRSGDPYFANDLSFIASVAELASIALENTLLYRQRIRMLEYSGRLLESLSSGVVAVATDGTVTNLNSAARRLLSLSEPQHRPETLADLPSPVAWCLALAVRVSWEAQESEVSIEHPTRGVLPVVLSSAVLKDDSLAVSGAFVVVTDLSAVKRLERNQRRLEHLGMMARFYAGIAHEIRSPLAAISTFISMLPDRFDDPEYRDTAARLLPSEVSRIVKLADRLRSMAPSEGGTLSPVDLGRLLADMVAFHASAAHTRGIDIALRCSPALPMILGDHSQLMQLVVNLLNNSIDAMPEGGSITITANHISRPQGATVLVEVIDGGSGVPPDIRTRIFDPFFTTKPTGVGLGLSICKEIADFHRARLTLHARLEAQGTIAPLEFPAPHTSDGSAHLRHDDVPSLAGDALA